MAAARSLVVVARPEPSPTDSLADVLRESCTVRTAYSIDDVLDRLDEEVDAVLVDPALADDAIPRVCAAVDERDLVCQVGLLADGDDRSATDRVDTTVPLTAGDGRVRDTVEWLAMRAQYRKTLDECYELAQASADLERAKESQAVAAELDRLQGQIERLRRRLDETAEELDTRSLFEAALRRDRDE